MRDLYSNPEVFWFAYDMEKENVLFVKLHRRFNLDAYLDAYHVSETLYYEMESLSYMFEDSIGGEFTDVD